MIIQLESGASQQAIEEVEAVLSEIAYKKNEISTQFAKYWVCIGKNEFDIRRIGSLAAVSDVHRVSDSFKLVSSKWKVGPSCVDLGDGVKIGGGHFQTMMGPCSIESDAQIEETIAFLKKNNIKIMRGGVYKPRSSPYAFRGLGQDGLKIWHEIAKEAGVKIVTEVMQVSQVEDMADYVDIFQVGARNSQNFNLLDALGEVDKAVLLKRGMSGTLDELLSSAEYIFSHGNEKIMLCERGIRTYETAYRNTFDINAIPILKEKSHLPVVSDPSHGVGIRKYVSSVTLSSIMAGADAAIVEIHSCPQKAFSDGQQTLDFNQAEKLISDINRVRELHKEL